MREKRLRLISFIIALLMVIGLVFAAAWIGISIGLAEEDEEYIEAWVLCQPNSWVNSRRFPKKDAEVNAYLDSGTKLYLDGKTKRGFAHCVGMNNEDGEGWVYKGFLVYSEPVPDGHVYPIDAKGRVACRRYVNGTRRCWAHKDDPVTVYMVSDEWCLTNKGFIKTEFIDLTTRLDISKPTDPDEMTWEEEDAA